MYYVRNRTARKSLDYRTPLELLTGDTPDISDITTFEFYQPVQYLDNPESKFPIQKNKLGRWVGVAVSVGQVLTYWILTAKGTVIARSTVGPVDDVSTPAVQKELDAFDAAVQEVIEPTELGDATAPTVRRRRHKEALKVARRDRNTDGGDDDLRNRHTIYDINEGVDHNYTTLVNTQTPTMKMRKNQKTAI